MIRTLRPALRRRLIAAAAIAVLGALVPIAVASGDQSPSSQGFGNDPPSGQPVRAALPPGRINHILLVVVTFNESEAAAGDPPATSSCCYEQPGPNTVAPGDDSSTAPTNSAPGGGKVGALLLSSRYIQPGTEDTTGSYNHYSALRSYEDLLGLTSGGADGLGHLGFAAAPGLAPFGRDVFNRDGGG
jgi:hypothetical protein